MQLKPAFQNYENLRQAYDSIIIEMAMHHGKYNFLFFFVQVIFNKYFYILKVFT